MSPYTNCKNTSVSAEFIINSAKGFFNDTSRACKINQGIGFFMIMTAKVLCEMRNVCDAFMMVNECITKTTQY